MLIHDVDLVTLIFYPRYLTHPRRQIVCGYTTSP